MSQASFSESDASLTSAKGRSPLLNDVFLQLQADATASRPALQKEVQALGTHLAERMGCALEADQRTSEIHPPNRFTSRYKALNLSLLISSVMTSTASSDSWYQEAAAAQIRSERSQKAELLNGRVAMLGFVIGLLTEALTGHGIVSQITFCAFGCN